MQQSADCCIPKKRSHLEKNAVACTHELTVGPECKRPQAAKIYLRDIKTELPSICCSCAVHCMTAPERISSLIHCKAIWGYKVPPTL